MDHQKTKILYAVGLGLILSDIIPTPADVVYFKFQQKQKEKLNSGEITPKQYWTREALAYYGLNPLWWGAVLSASYFIGKDYTQRRNIFLTLLAGGMVFGALKSNIKKDTILLSKDKS